MICVSLPLLRKTAILLRQSMRKKNKIELDRVLNGEAILHKDRVRCDIAMGSKPRKNTLLHTNSRLLLYSRTPMGLQLTIVRYSEVECITSGKTKGRPYLQLLGDDARVLLLFKSKSAREDYRRFFEGRIPDE